MKRHQLSIVVLATTVITLCVALSADAGLRQGGRNQLLPQALHGTAFASLEPIGEVSGEVTGWGRIVVRDANLPSGLKRFIQVWLFGLEPRTGYLIKIDSVEIGTVQTRASGNGVLKLQNDGRGHQMVPPDLPPVGELFSAIVLMDGGLSVLQGEFTTMESPRRETTYEEEIVLDEANESGAMGMAKVEMKGEEYQEFMTRASGLIPGLTYSIFVQGPTFALTVATVTAGAEGQARVHLEYPDDENPLPPDLMPVSDIEMVEWLDPDGFAVLTGFFTGLGVCDKLVGIVTAGDENEFTLDTLEGPVTVITDEDTVWEDFGDHDFSIDDKLKVEGCWDGDTFMARAVEYKDCCDQDTCFKLVGTATEIIPDVQFTLVTEEGPVTVLITGETVMEDFGGNELSDGDLVKVEGCPVGDDFVADVIELKRSVHEEKCFKLVGTATEIIPDVSFDLVSGKGTITVLMTADTMMEGFGGEDIAEGDKVKVEGCMAGDDFVADVVELKKSGKP
jgi:hypothetical protein